MSGYTSTTAQLSDDDIAVGNEREEKPPVIEGQVEEVTQTEEEAAAAEAEAKKKPGVVSWEQRRINALTRKVAEESRRAQLAESHAAQVIAAAQAAAETDPTAAAAAAAAKGNGRVPTEAEFNAAVAATAAKAAFDADCTKIYNDGMDELPGFEGRLKNFAAVGGMSQPLIEAVMESAAGAISPQKILFELGGNMDEAARIAELPPVRMAAAIARFAATLSGEAKQVTKAPPPLTRVTPSAAPVKEKDPEKMNAKEWREWREKDLAAKRAARG